MQTTQQRFDAEIAAVWREYLDATRGQPEPRYGEVEPWAWNRLQTKLRAIDVRRRALAAKT